MYCHSITYLTPYLASNWICQCIDTQQQLDNLYHPTQHVKDFFNICSITKLPESGDLFVVILMSLWCWKDHLSLQGEGDPPPPQTK